MRRREFNQRLTHFNILVGVAAIVMEQEERRRRNRPQRRWWVRPWLARRPGALFRKSMFLDRDFLNSAPGLYTENSGNIFPGSVYPYHCGRASVTDSS